MTAMASQITSLMIVYSTVYSSADQRKHQSSASLAFVGGIHRRSVNSPHKGPVTRKMFPSETPEIRQFDIFIAINLNKPVIYNTMLLIRRHCIKTYPIRPQVHISVTKMAYIIRIQYLSVPVQQPAIAPINFPSVLYPILAKYSRPNNSGMAMDRLINCRQLISWLDYQLMSNL